MQEINEKRIDSFRNGLAQYSIGKKEITRW